MLDIKTLTLLLWRQFSVAVVLCLGLLSCRKINLLSWVSSRAACRQSLCLSHALFSIQGVWHGCHVRCLPWRCHCWIPCVTVVCTLSLISAFERCTSLSVYKPWPVWLRITDFLSRGHSVFDDNLLQADLQWCHSFSVQKNNHTVLMGIFSALGIFISPW